MKDKDKTKNSKLVKPKKKGRGKKRGRPRKPKEYYILMIMQNKKKHKVIFRSYKKDPIVEKFNQVKEYKPFYPKETMWKDRNTNKKLVKVKMECLLLRKRIFWGDKFLVGMKSVKIDDPEWVPIDKCDYYEEEEFIVTGANRKMTAEEIYENLIIKGLSDYSFKQILILNNKLIIEGDQLNVVICKTTEECVRLYNFYRVLCDKEKIKKIAFLGSLRSPVNRTEWYTKIHEETKIPLNRLYRKWTR